MSQEFETRYRQAQAALEGFVRALGAAQFLNEALEIAASADEAVIYERKQLRLNELRAEHAQVKKDAEDAQAEAKRIKAETDQEIATAQDLLLKTKAQLKADERAAYLSAQTALQNAKIEFDSAIKDLTAAKLKADTEFHQEKARLEEELQKLRDAVTIESVKLADIRRLREQLQKI